MKCGHPSDSRLDTCLDCYDIHLLALDRKRSAAAVRLDCKAGFPLDVDGRHVVPLQKCGSPTASFICRAAEILRPDAAAEK